MVVVHGARYWRHRGCPSAAVEAGQPEVRPVHFDRREREGGHGGKHDELVAREVRAQGERPGKAADRRPDAAHKGSDRLAHPVDGAQLPRRRRHVDQHHGGGEGGGARDRAPRGGGADRRHRDALVGHRERRGGQQQPHARGEQQPQARELQRVEPRLQPLEAQGAEREQGGAAHGVRHRQLPRAEAQAAVSWRRRRIDRCHLVGEVEDEGDEGVAEQAQPDVPLPPPWRSPQLPELRGSPTLNVFVLLKQLEISSIRLLRSPNCPLCVFLLQRLRRLAHVRPIGRQEVALLGLGTIRAVWLHLPQLVLLWRVAPPPPPKPAPRRLASEQARPALRPGTAFGAGAALLCGGQGLFHQQGGGNCGHNLDNTCHKARQQERPARSRVRSQSGAFTLRRNKCTTLFQPICGLRAPPRPLSAGRSRGGGMTVWKPPRMLRHSTVCSWI
mmetsp:Transcript_11777/g.29802  ORF Transcript_11777/g.29802 Transcript_11777/m.29802 type:complete len:444 (+) Transcript_11777:1179-2510(+)